MRDCLLLARLRHCACAKACLLARLRHCACAKTCLLARLRHCACAKTCLLARLRHCARAKPCLRDCLLLARLRHCAFHHLFCHIFTDLLAHLRHPLLSPLSPSRAYDTPLARSPSAKYSLTCTRACDCRYDVFRSIAATKHAPCTRAELAHKLTLTDVGAGIVRGACPRRHERATQVVARAIQWRARLLRHRANGSAAEDVVCGFVIGRTIGATVSARAPRRDTRCTLQATRARLAAGPKRRIAAVPRPVAAVHRTRSHFGTRSTHMKTGRAQIGRCATHAVWIGTIVACAARTSRRCLPRQAHQRKSPATSSDVRISLAVPKRLANTIGTTSTLARHKHAPRRGNADIGRARVVVVALNGAMRTRPVVVA
jgi:hypothetical protein